MKVTYCFLLFLLVNSVYALNPLGFRGYDQKVSMTFKSEAEAKKANLVVKPLPADYTLAFSARWDDATPAHLNTHKLMVKNKIKGTFFLNNFQWVLKRDKNYLKKLLKGGCSLGLHTVNHPTLTSWNSYAHFRQYMLNRIDIETGAQTAVNSQVLPYCNWWAPAPIIPKSIGKAMMGAGVISSPDVMYPSREKELAYPKNSMALSKIVTPGDRVPDLDRLDKQLKKYLGNKQALAVQPSLSIGIHSWHNAEGLKKLDQAFAKVAGKPKWWYCNQNEYGAYRYEALNTTISKRVNGKKVEFAIRRMQPIELGALVPLWFTVDGAKPLSVSVGKLHRGSLELPHDKTQTLPEVFGRTDSQGNSETIPFAQLTLKHRPNGKWAATLKNNSDKTFNDVAFSFRFPAAFEKAVIRKDRKGLAAGKKITAVVEQKPASQEFFYRFGNPYYAVQCDFIKDGKRYRLYADLEEKREGQKLLTVNDAATIVVCPEDADLAKLSSPEIRIADTGIKPMELKKNDKVGTGVVAPSIPRKIRGKTTYLAILDFKPKTDSIVLKSTAGRSWKKGEVWLNGKKLAFSHNKAKLNLKEGVNRLVLKSYRSQTQFLLFNDEKEQCVDFVAPVM